ncbi:hypothetical protein LTR05_005678 [Lithohypha guttulata]|uniref:F-box domain-containing protein n=1 Tax=Lithohypha guttulata TaxID=1690604 RepID=A0AAN7YFQ5_9EURO|nr:hypothetical protein LTR05_005678 [Lithohypha guttulata]
MATINSLPNKILAQIVGYLDEVDENVRLSQYIHDWTIVEDPYNLSIGEYDLSVLAAMQVNQLWRKVVLNMVSSKVERVLEGRMRRSIALKAIKCFKVAIRRG